jgi:hypothetical protein
MYNSTRFVNAPSSVGNLPVISLPSSSGRNEDRCTKCCEKIFTIGDVVGITIERTNNITDACITRPDLSIFLAPLVSSPSYRYHLVVVGMKIGRNEDR